MVNSNLNKLALKDGSNIAVVGGGPSGSFFTYFALDYANRYGEKINIDIFEAKKFNCTGPAGCNHCGGIVSESLINMLSLEGIELPPDVIRRNIESYTLHLEQGSTVIEASADEQKITSMFRGLGPTGCKPNGNTSFDNFLLELCQSKGAKIIHEKVTNLERKKDGILVTTELNKEKKYDFVVGANGLNQQTFNLFNKICPSFEPPEVSRTFIGEIQMEEKLANQFIGNSMHVFLLNLPHIKFGALIPKGSYITLVLLGSDINKDVVDSFLNSEVVRKCFPENYNFNLSTKCQCYPFINVKRAKFAYADRLVMIGDSATSKLYKNGIGAAYITGKAAADTAIFHGISEADFKKYYQPICSSIAKDNKIGRFIFSITSIIQKSSILKSAMLNIVINEQKKEKHKRRMSSILWDTFTGGAPYKDVFIRFLNPVLIFKLIFNIIQIPLKRIISKNNVRHKTNKTPTRSKNIFTDIKYFFLNKPPIKTLINFENEEERHLYCESIMQRTGIVVEDFKMLNIHRIGIEAPGRYIFDELLKWDGDSSCWPNHIAKVNLVDNNLEQIKIFLFGRTKYLWGLKNGFFGLRLFHLFDLSAIKIRKVPSINDPDNARYLLYECKGGYPIGIFSMFVRSSIPERGEKEMSQLFIMVGFDFFGSQTLSKFKLIKIVWEFFHNRVTSNVAYRFKELCEWKFEKFTQGN